MPYMPYINYNNLYSVKTLTSNDLIEDLSEFQKLICNDNYTKNIYTDELKDISFITFDNSLNKDSIDLDNGRIENVSQISINPRKYRYIKFDFQRYITIHNVRLHDVNNIPIPFILWTKSNNTNSYDISSDKVTEISLNNIETAVFEIYPDTYGIDIYSNRINSPHYLLYKTVDTDKVFYYPIDPSVSFIEYYAFNNNYKHYFNSDYPQIYYGNGGHYLNNRTPTLTETQNIINGSNFYGDINDNFFTIEEINNYLVNNTKIEFNRSFFDNSGHETKPIKDLSDFSYSLRFNYNNIDDTSNNMYDTSNVYIDLSSHIFSLFNINVTSVDASLTNITINNNTFLTLDLSINTEISFNFTYNPYKPVKLSISDVLNGTYELVATTNNIIDKTNGSVQDKSLSIYYDIPIITYNDEYILTKHNTGSKLRIQDASSYSIYSKHLTSNFLITKDILGTTLTSTNIDLNQCVASSITCESFNTTTTNIYANNANITNIKNTSLDICGSLNIYNNANFKLIYPNILDISNTDTDIIRLVDDKFLSYENNTLVINKSINTDILYVNHLYVNKFCHKLSNSDISFGFADISNIIINRDLLINTPTYYHNFNKPINGGIKIKDNGHVYLAHYYNYRKSDTLHDGYRMKITSYKTSLYDSGWNISLNTENNLYCKSDSYIRLYPLKNNHSNVYTNVFEIESRYLKYNTILPWIKNMNDISNVEYLSNIIYKDSDNSIIVKEYSELSKFPDTSSNYPNLYIINQLKPKLFVKDISYSKYETGLIAQDLQQITDLSYLVYSNNNDYKKESEKLFINYNGLQPYIAAAIQEIYFIVEKFNSKIINNQLTI